MRSRRVLLVDANHDSRAVYRIMLQHVGWQVLEAEHGGAALDVLRREAVDAVVTELTLHPLDGYHLLAQVRSSERLRDTCVVVLTARALQEERERAERAGCSLFLVKPLEPQQLLRELEELVR
jgi:CheY-like chemotaxis protein